MRLIGNLDNKTHAERFASYLLTQDITSHVEFEDDRWDIWIRDEDQIPAATKLLDEFQTKPDALEYRGAIEQAQVIARNEEKKRQQAQKNLVDVQQKWNSPITRRAPLTMVLLAVSIVVAILTNLGQSDGATFRALSASYLTQEQAVELVGSESLDEYNTRMRLGSILRGEVWRMITPIFIHFGVFHILFNMMWLVYFGRQIESRYGTPWMGLLVVAFAIPANLAGLMVPEDLGGVPIQNFGVIWLVLAGGMSGVLYGLFGYIWMKMVFDRESGLFITPFSAAILLGWMIFCMAPDSSRLVGNIDNWAHGVGLVVGLIFGYFPKLLKDLGIGRKPE